jgi:hypothetical protein
VYGLFRCLRVRGDITRNAARNETLQARVDTIRVAVARLAEQSRQLHIRLDQMVTRDELSQTLDRVVGQLEQGVDARFEHQTRAVEALQMMVGETDELLQRVLDGLESIKTEDEAGHAEQSRAWNLTQARL